MVASLSYACEVVRVPALGATVRSAMRALYLSAYDGSSPALFDADLDAKDEVLLLRHDGQLVGFTTWRTFLHRWQGETVQVLYSGDTVVHPAHWGQTALSYAWVRHLAVIKQRQPDARLLWWLLVKGHRTYRYLEVFARHFHPREGHDDPALAALADALARQAFPAHYNPRTGVVEFSPSRGHLKPALAEPRPDELQRPGVACFLARNPGFRVGHELVCLCEIEPANMKPLTLRLFRASLAEAAHA